MAKPANSGPGAFRIKPGQIELNMNRRNRHLHFENTADRPIQVGSHVHLADVNTGLKFDRKAAYGFRLDIPAGTSIRFEPGVSKSLVIIEFGGAEFVPGVSLKDEYPQVAPSAEEA